MNTRTHNPGDDWQKWLTVAAALVAVGILPNRWGKFISLAAAITALSR